jgi:hypothetical protein
VTGETYRHKGPNTQRSKQVKRKQLAIIILSGLEQPGQPTETALVS